MRGLIRRRGIQLRRNQRRPIGDGRRGGRPGDHRSVQAHRQRYRRAAPRKLAVAARIGGADGVRSLAQRISGVCD